MEALGPVSLKIIGYAGNSTKVHGFITGSNRKMDFSEEVTNSFGLTNEWLNSVKRLVRVRVVSCRFQKAWKNIVFRRKCARAA
jgi:hypothetical protein